MITEQNFLVRYGLHNFVTFRQNEGKNIFFIRSLESQNMIRHAQRLIKDTYGDVLDVQLN